MILEVILAIILLIILIFISLGIRLVGSINKNGASLKFFFKVLIFSKIKIFSIEYPKTSKDEEKEEDGESNPIAFDLIKPCIKPALDFLKSFFKSLNVKVLDGHMDFGLSSYVSTAKYVGYMWAVLVVVNSTHEKANLTVTPCFDEPIFDFNGLIDVKINLFKLIVPFIRLISNRNILKLIKEAV